MSRLKRWLKTWPGIITGTFAALTLIGGTAVATGGRVIDMVEAPPILEAHIEYAEPLLGDNDSLHAEVHAMQTTQDFHTRLLCEAAGMTVRECEAEKNR